MSIQNVSSTYANGVIYAQTQINGDPTQYETLVLGVHIKFLSPYFGLLNTEVQIHTTHALGKRCLTDHYDTSYQDRGDLVMIRKNHSV